MFGEVRKRKDSWDEQIGNLIVQEKQAQEIHKKCTTSAEQEAKIQKDERKTKKECKAGKDKDKDKRKEKKKGKKKEKKRNEEEKQKDKKGRAQEKERGKEEKREPTNEGGMYTKVSY